MKHVCSTGGTEEVCEICQNRKIGIHLKFETGERELDLKMGNQYLSCQSGWTSTNLVGSRHNLVTTFESWENGGFAHKKSLSDLKSFSQLYRQAEFALVRYNSS